MALSIKILYMEASLLDPLLRAYALILCVILTELAPRTSKPHVV